jgi:hypothetical protein
MLKEVGASGQISLGKKYAGQLFDLQTAEDGSITMRPVKVVPMTPPAPSAQEERAAYTVAAAPAASATSATGDGWLTPERLARRAGAAARSPAEMEAARTQWEEENKDAIEAMNKRMAKIGSMSRRIHEWRTEKALREQAGLPAPTDQAV